MNDANGQLKSRREAEFPMKALELLFYIPLDNKLRCSISFLIKRWKSTSKYDVRNE